MNTRRLVRSTFLLAFTLQFGMSGPTFAWGSHGHTIVAKLAQERLSPKAKTSISALLGTTDLASICMWADDVKHNTRPETYNWHFVDIPRSQSSYDASRDCKPDPKGECAIKGLEKQIAILKNKNSSIANKADAVKFIVHIVGDIHQPFHAIDDNDQGGNKVLVKLNGKASHTGFGGKKSAYNLHEIWDDEVIASAKLSDAKFVASLDNALKTQDESKIAQGNPVQWVEASHTEAQTFYVTSGTNITDAYLKKALPVVQRQLAEGGVRLAHILNAIFL